MRVKQTRKEIRKYFSDRFISFDEPKKWVSVRKNQSSFIGANAAPRFEENPTKSRGVNRDDSEK